MDEIDIEKYKAAIKAHTERLLNDPVALAEWRKQFINPWVEIEGDERDYMYLILKLLDPCDSSNDQRFITNYYTYADSEYRITYVYDDFILERKEQS